jgi:hypothetical protein
MKILYHHRTQAKGGEGVHIREIIKSFRSLGHEVVIVSPPGIDVFQMLQLERLKPSPRNQFCRKCGFGSVNMLRKFFLSFLKSATMCLYM